MRILKMLKFAKYISQKTPFTVEHFSISKVGNKYYIYAHPHHNNFIKKMIGRYNSYEQAKNTIDNVLDLRLESYGS